MLWTLFICRCLCKCTKTVQSSMQATQKWRNGECYLYNTSQRKIVQLFFINSQWMIGWRNDVLLACWVDWLIASINSFIVKFAASSHVHLSHVKLFIQLPLTNCISAYLIYVIFRLFSTSSPSCFQITCILKYSGKLRYLLCSVYVTLCVQSLCTEPR